MILKCKNSQVNFLPRLLKSAKILKCWVKEGLLSQKQTKRYIKSKVISFLEMNSILEY